MNCSVLIVCSDSIISACSGENILKMKTKCNWIENGSFVCDMKWDFIK